MLERVYKKIEELPKELYEHLYEANMQFANDFNSAFFRPEDCVLIIDIDNTHTIVYSSEDAPKTEYFGDMQLRYAAYVIFVNHNTILKNRYGYRSDDVGFKHKLK